MTRGSLRWSRAPWALVVATVLALAANLAPITAPRALAAADGLSLTGSTTYTVVPARHVVRVVLDLTATNNKANTTSGGIVTRWFWQSVRVAVQPEARNVRATSGGARLATIVKPADGEALVEARFRSGLFYHQTIKVRIAYDLPAGAPRSTSRIRVGTAFATFVAWAFGDTGSVRIVVPAGFEAETTGSDLTKTTSGGATVLTASGISDVGAWYAVVNADRKAALTSERIDLPGGEHFVIRGWPEDAEWRKRVSALLTDGLPELTKLIGLDWPVAADLEVFEVYSPLLEGYAGVFFESQDRIEISEDLDDLTIIHEASHAWFNRDLFQDRWLNEGFADTYAARTLDAVGTGGWVPDKVSPSDPAAVALTEWTHPGRINDKDTSAREHYGYEASWTVIRSLLSEIGVEGMQTVLRAAKDREIAYVGAVEPEKVGGAVDWQRFLDLLDEAGGSTTADDLFQRWVVDAADRERLDARSQARTDYRALADAGGDWLPPAYVRVPMSSWDFTTAEQRIAEAAQVLTRRSVLATVLAPIGADAPTDLRAAYETATTDMTAAQATVEREIVAARALVAADAAVKAPRDVFASIGLIGVTPDADLAVARMAFERGDGDAAARAASVTALIGEAAAIGQGRAMGGVGGLIVLALLVVAAIVLIRRRRSSGPPAIAEATTSYATLPDQSAEVAPMPVERPSIAPPDAPSDRPPDPSEERDTTS